MKKSLLTLPILLSFSLASCGQNQDSMEINQQPVSVTQTGVIESVTGKTSEVETVTGVTLETSGVETEAINTGTVAKENNENTGSTEKGKKITFKDEVQAQIKTWDFFDEKTGNSIVTYNIDNFEKDIQTLTKTPDWLYENFVQLYSKEKRFNKTLSLEFLESIKNWNLKDAESLLENNDLRVVFGKEVNGPRVSPFYPTCCAFKMYKAVSEYKNGLLWVYVSWNGSWDYRFYYITSFKNSLVEFSFNSHFSEEISENPGETNLFYLWKKIMWPTKIQEEYNNYIKDLFIGKKTSPDFTKEMEKAKLSIDALYN